MPPKRVPFSDRVGAALPGPAAARPDPAIFGESPEPLTILDLPLDQIMPNLDQPRKHFDDESLNELAASIREKGVLFAITVKPIKAITRWEGSTRRYEIIAGERRWRASARAGKTTIPAIIREDMRDQSEALEVALIENIQREDLNPLEEGVAFLQLKTDIGYSYADIARRIGKTKSYVQRRIELASYPADLQQLVRSRPESMSHAGEIVRLLSEEQRAPLIAAVHEGLSFKETRQWVEAILNPAIAASPMADTQPIEGSASPLDTLSEVRSFDAKKRIKQARRAVIEILDNINSLDGPARTELLSVLIELTSDLEQVMKKIAEPK